MLLNKEKLKHFLPIKSSLFGAFEREILSDIFITSLKLIIFVKMGEQFFLPKFIFHSFPLIVLTVQTSYDEDNDTVRN